MELLLNQVMSGRTRCCLNDKTFFVCPPSPAHKLEASIVYDEALADCSFRGILTEEQMMETLIRNGLWSVEEDSELKSIPIKVDGIKVQMYHDYVNFRSKRVEQNRRVLEKIRKRQTELARKRHKYDLYTDVGLAGAFKLQYLIEKNTVDEDEGRVFVGDISEIFMRKIIEEFMRNSPNDAELRELSKYEKWRLVWSSGRQEGRVFGVPSTWLTEEQQNLIGWSKLYDNVNEHPESPSKDIMDDNDLLDGWIIVEQKKREKDKQEGGGSGRGGGQQEVFIPAESKEDAERINQMNDAGATLIKKQRAAALKQQGLVNEQHMPDSQQKINMQAAQQFRDRMAKGRK